MVIVVRFMSWYLIGSFTIDYHPNTSLISIIIFYAFILCHYIFVGILFWKKGGCTFHSNDRMMKIQQEEKRITPDKSFKGPIDISIIRAKKVQTSLINPILDIRGWQ